MPHCCGEVVGDGDVECWEGVWGFCERVSLEGYLAMMMDMGGHDKVEVRRRA